MKKFISLFLTVLICLCAVSCGKNSDGGENTDETTTNVNTNTAVAGKWVCTLSLADVISEAEHTVWSQKLEGEFRVTMELSEDGSVKLSADYDAAREYIEAYLISSNYSEEAAVLKAELCIESLQFGDELDGITFSVKDKVVEFSSGARMNISEQGKYLTPDVESFSVHHNGDMEACTWYETVISAIKFERA